MTDNLKYTEGSSMLELYADEIVKTLCETLGRSLIITNMNAVIIAAPAEERIGTIHSPSIPVMKYGKMSFDDAEAARQLGVWYPGATVPIFFQGKVVGSVAIAGEPDVVGKFALLVKNQVESILREKVLIESSSFSQRSIDDLARRLYCFDPAKDDKRVLAAHANKYGYTLDSPRVVVAVEFSNFRELNPLDNKLSLSYRSGSDPFQDELDYQVLKSNVINVMRNTFSNPQDLIASSSRDRFIVLKALENTASNSRDRLLDNTYEQAKEVFGVLHKSSIDTTIAIGSTANNLNEIPFSYDNAWDTVLIAHKMQLASGVFCFHNFSVEHVVLSVKKQPRHSFIWERLSLIKKQTDGKELTETFLAYCENSFRKQKAAEHLFIHRNTLLYRLNKIERLLNIDLNDFNQALSLYLAFRMDEISPTHQDIDTSG